MWAIPVQKGQHQYRDIVKDKQGNRHELYWVPPKLPDWALPNEYKADWALPNEYKGGQNEPTGEQLEYGAHIDAGSDGGDERDELAKRIKELKEKIIGLDDESVAEGFKSEAVTPYRNNDTESLRGIITRMENYIQEKELDVY
jgi:hypothetical protein